MHEEYHDLTSTGSTEPLGERTATDRAVIEGIANTGRLVTSAAMILFSASIELSSVPAVEVTVLAAALALGIAIDAVIVRGLLAPVLVGVLGRANWTRPRSLRRALLLPAAPSQPPPGVRRAYGALQLVLRRAGWFLPATQSARSGARIEPAWADDLSPESLSTGPTIGGLDRC